MLCSRVHFLLVEPFVMRHRRVVRISMNGKQKKNTECRQCAVERFHGSLRYGLSLASQDALSGVSGTFAKAQKTDIVGLARSGHRPTRRADDGQLSTRRRLERRGKPFRERRRLDVSCRNKGCRNQAVKQDGADCK